MFVTQWQNVATLLPALRWEVKNVPNELDDFPKELSNLSVEGNSIFLLPYNKT